VTHVQLYLAWYKKSKKTQFFWFFRHTQIWELGLVLAMKRVTPQGFVALPVNITNSNPASSWAQIIVDSGLSLGPAAPWSVVKAGGRLRSKGHTSTASEDQETIAPPMYLPYSWLYTFWSCIIVRMWFLQLRVRWEDSKEMGAHHYSSASDNPW
jgi:hypothetical protein